MKIKSIRNISIKTKLVLLGAISIGGLILMGVESTLTARQINQASTDISQSWLPSIIIAEELNASISDYRLKENYHVIAGDTGAMKETETQLQELRKEIQADFEKYQTSYIANHEDREMMVQAKQLWSRYLECSDRLLSASKNNETEKALELIREDSKRLFDESRHLFLEVVEFNKQGAEAASIHGDQLYRSLTKMKIIFIGLLGSLIAALVIYIILAVEKPVKAIAEGTRRVSNGDLDVYLKYDSEDEIGVLTSSVNALITRLNDIIKDEKYLLHEIGNENYEAKSGCQQAYRGDFAPILYSITSLQSQLKHSQMNQKKYTEKPIQKATIERIQVKRQGKKK